MKVIKWYPRTYRVFFSAAYGIFREIFGDLMLSLSNGESMSLAEVKFCFSTLFNFLPHGLENKPTHIKKTYSENNNAESTWCVFK